MYKVIWESLAQKSLIKLTKGDWTLAKKIKFKVETELAKNPYKNGEPLKGNLKGRWKYRFSKYRVIYEIKQTKLLIIVIEVGHRREIYK
ncbi:MAG: type II toxin-antitoxin system RelE/ParE family toxin [Candidatus Moeniiplasma glomeromycotorum]|nr:type II toxin-antitoxin system RelE/ParE family toxin [Candidatus Moeniiplasma glomeromycotorum]MCE8168276.1 type II toxin-antitoxin system RelE/ParE family toxin [Candidatus Moeniiplasma glomeromycotorum]MCE8169816.1 type II toxin-antitoxin system RelE/ParE family toxin [Candidatus Moeniiplasma glomeromycotorum]